jgi:hypothetical protein
MISPQFYTKENRVKSFSFSKLKHYPRKNLSFAVGYTLHEVKDGEDLYSIAGYYFGEFGERYWTTIADVNDLSKPDWLNTGQVIKIPRAVVEDKIDIKTTYDRNVSTAIKI